MKARHLILLLGLLAGMAGCKNDDPESRVLTLTVASRVQVIPTADETIPYVYYVKYEGSEDWQSFPNYITGFSHEEGYEYTLKVKETEIKNPPQDASTLRYDFMQLISKIKKDSEDLPF